MISKILEFLFIAFLMVCFYVFGWLIIGIGTIAKL
jgi:hypothetical protein